MAAVGKSRLLYALIMAASAVYFIGLIHYARLRPIDGDEGFYATAARLVSEGRILYRDFLYQHLPLLPYLYSYVWGSHFQSLVDMRFLSATCGALALLLWGIHTLSVEKVSTKAALLTFALLAINPCWISHDVLVEYYAVTNLLISAAIITLYIALKTSRLGWYFGSGLLLGACASARSTYAPVIAALVLFLFFKERSGILSDAASPNVPSAAQPSLPFDEQRGMAATREHDAGTSKLSPMKMKRTAAFIVGSGCGLLPTVNAFAHAPRAFIFDNFTYHGFQADYQTLGHTFLVYVAGIAVFLFVLHPYFTLETVLAVAGWRAARRYAVENRGHGDRHRDLYLGAASLMAAVYVFAALIPFPPFYQYFDTPLVPFLMPLITEGVLAVTRLQAKVLLVLLLATPVLALAEFASDARAYSDPRWSMSSFLKVASNVAANSKPDDVVLSFWPGYVFQSGRSYFSGSENEFAYRVSGRITTEAGTRYHIVSKQQILKAVSDREVSVFVTDPAPEISGSQLPPDDARVLRDALRANYLLVAKIDGVEIYRRR